MTTDLGIFQVMYQGTPQASFEDVGASSVFYALAGGGYSVNVVAAATGVQRDLVESTIANFRVSTSGLSSTSGCRQLPGVNFRVSTSGQLPGCAPLRATLACFSPVTGGMHGRQANT
jgi:hypothetical protein